MMNGDLGDQYLLDRGVVFLPWIGEYYEQGFRGRRLLVLGESHYDEWDGERHALGSEFTRQCIEEVVNRISGANFWKNLEQALLNEARESGWAPNGGGPLWNRLAFYNFFQSPVPGGPRVRPDWNLAQGSRELFRAVLEQLRPERVLVCGKGLWKWMEDIEEGEDQIHDDIQAYRLVDGSQVWCLATVHPSSGRYSWSRLYPLITAFLDNPQRAAGLLRA